jgi:hypothetical protein
MPISIRHAVVISHDCEFNEGKRKYMALARIDHLDLRRPQEELDAMRRANSPTTASAEGLSVQFDAFYLDPLPEQFDGPRVINFQTITPFPMSMKAEILAVKCGELTPTARRDLRGRLAAFFGRDGEEEEGEGQAEAQGEL